MCEKEEDRVLLERIRAGDKAACDDCIRQHAPGVYRLALRLMRNEAEAEDVMQETFLNAFKGIHRFDGRAALRTWLYRIAYNAALVHLRRPKPEFLTVEEASEPEDGTPVPQQLFDWSRLPEQELERAELRAQMEGAIRELPEKLRAVFVMRELEDLSTEETAEALGVKIEVVKTRLHRARLRLRERLSAYLASEAPASQG
jgi:RNA polymerase sigma-70 factor (ECF subfamily)